MSPYQGLLDSYCAKWPYLLWLTLFSFDQYVQTAANRSRNDHRLALKVVMYFFRLERFLFCSWHFIWVWKSAPIVRLSLFRARRASQRKLSREDNEQMSVSYCDTLNAVIDRKKKGGGQFLIEFFVANV